MAGITLAQADAQLALWLAASTAVAANQSYTIAGRTLTRAHAAEVRKMLDYWEAKVKSLSVSAGTGSRVRYVVGP
jgi:hypothetical protein